jgi:hypothetical protein
LLSFLGAEPAVWPWSSRSKSTAAQSDTRIIALVLAGISAIAAVSGVIGVGRWRCGRGDDHGQHVLAFFREAQAERATEALREFLPPHVRVRRDG